MTILSVLREVAAQVGLNVPNVVFASTQREHIELAGVANEMAARIAFDTHDWTALKTLGTITGDGMAEGFEFPADYRRMLKNGSLWPSTTPFAPLCHVADTDEWLGMVVQNGQWMHGLWTIIGDQIMIRPAVGIGATAQFYYLTDRVVRAVNGTLKAAFDADTDTFRLDERVLRLGIIWQWRAAKGLPYAEDMATYEEALASRIVADKGSNIIAVGRKRWTRYDVRPAYPGALGP